MTESFDDSELDEAEGGELSLEDLQDIVSGLSLDDASPEALALRYSLGDAEMEDGSAGRAVTQFELVVAAWTRELGATDPDTMTARGSLGRALTEARLNERAEQVLRELLVDRTAVLGPDHPSTLVTRGNLLRAIGYGGRPEEALQMAEELLADRVRILGPVHPETLQTRGHIGRILSEAGRTDEAIAVLEQVLADRERVLGVEHDDTWTSRFNLTMVQFDDDRISIDELMAFLVDQTERQGFDHPGTMTVRASLAAALTDDGRTAEAEIAVRQLIHDRQRVLGELDPATLWAHRLLGKLLVTTGRPEEALRYFDALAQTSKQTLGATALISLRARLALAWGLSIHDPDDRLEAEVRSLVEDADQSLEPAHPLWDTIDQYLALIDGEWDDDGEGDDDPTAEEGE